MKISKSPCHPVAPVAGADVAAFDGVVSMIQSSRGRALASATASLIELYWKLGEYISRKLESAAWGEGVVDALAAYIADRHPNLVGFTRRNLFRMGQFFEAYRGQAIVSALLTQLPWTHHLMVLARCKRSEEREFYIRLCLQEKWSSRELDRQLKGCLFEQAILNPAQGSQTLKELHPAAADVFRDSHLLEFLDLTERHLESDLYRRLLQNIRRFLAELGRDFCFVGSEVQLQVGNRDFSLDLLSFHRGLNSLVAIALKVDQFEPAHLGQLGFYLEAIDRNAAVRRQRPLGGGVCPESDDFARARCRIPLATARQGSSSIQVAGILCFECSWGYRPEQPALRWDGNMTHLLGRRARTILSKVLREWPTSRGPESDQSRDGTTS